MATVRQYEIDRIYNELFKRGIHLSLNLIGLIRKDAITLHRLFEHECNACTREKFLWESWGDYNIARKKQMEWVEKRQTQVLVRLKSRLESVDIPYYIQSDPRGCSLYLCTTSRENYHQEGIPVY